MTMTADHGSEIIEGEEIIDISSDTTALATINRTEIDQQIATAKRFPRSIARAKRNMVEMATLDVETATSCFYSLRRKGRDGKPVFIEGPSARLAEIAACCWGNIRHGARIVSEDGKFITAQGVCYDLENNVYCSMEVRRRITDRNGRKYGDDMVAVTGNAGSSIADRNAVLKVVPRAIVNAAYQAARATAAGDAKTMGQRRLNAVAEFKKLGVGVNQIVSMLGKPDGAGTEDIGTDDLIRLFGVLNAIKDGDATVDSIFGNDEPETNSTTAAINAGLKPATAAEKKAAVDAAAKIKQEAAERSQVDPAADLAAEANDQPVDQASGLRRQAKEAESPPKSHGASPQRQESPALAKEEAGAGGSTDEAVADPILSDDPIEAELVKFCVAKRPADLTEVQARDWVLQAIRLMPKSYGKQTSANHKLIAEKAREGKWPVWPTNAD